MSTQSITLHSRRPPVCIPDDHVYFAFASGRLTYDCVTCGAQCCRGHGYATAIGPELQGQLARRPHLRFFLRAPGRPRDGYDVQNCPPACFFLTEGGLCGLHCDEGYDAKPETCRLFPFNSIQTLGDYLIVAPHPTLCPLRVVPRGMSDPKSVYDTLLNAMRSQGISGTVPSYQPAHADVDPLITLERGIVELSKQDMCYPVFAALQLQLTVASGLCSSPGSAPVYRPSPDYSSVAVDAFLRRCCDVLGLAYPVSSAANTDVDWIMTSLSPYLRTGLVFRDAGKSGAVRPAPSLDRVPYVLLASYLMTILARFAGMREITFQTVTRLQQSCGDLIWLLSDVDRPMVWGSEVQVDLSSVRSCYEGPFIRIAKALLPLAQGRHATPLGDILAAENRFSDLDRVNFLRFVASRLLGRLVPAESQERRRNRSRMMGVRASLRPRLQRWGLGRLDERTLRLASNRKLAGRILRRW